MHCVLPVKRSGFEDDKQQSVISALFAEPAKEPPRNPPPPAQLDDDILKAVSSSQGNASHISELQTKRNPKWKPLPPVRKPPTAPPSAPAAEKLPDDSTAAGAKELGNALFKRGQWQKAADAYSRCAMACIMAGCLWLACWMKCSRLYECSLFIVL